MSTFLRLGTEIQRVKRLALGLFPQSELHATRDQRRLFLYNMMVGGGHWHGAVASQAAMLALHSTSDRGCWERDMCRRTDLDGAPVYVCTGGNGKSVANWEVLGGGGGGTAASTSYDPSASGLESTDVQAAIDEIALALADLGTPLVDPTTSVGDIIVRGASGLNRLGIGAEGKVLGVSGGTLAYLDSVGGGFSLSSDQLIASISPLAWWRADAGVEETDGDPAEDGDGVSRWIDQSGHGYHLTQATAGYRPTHEAGEIGGRAIIRFAAHHLTNAALPLDLKNHTMVVVAKSTATSGQNYGRLACVGLPASGYDYNVANAQTWTFDNTGTPEVRVNSGNANYGLSLSYTQVGRPASLRAYGYRITSGMAILSASDLLSAAATNNYSTTSVGLNIGCQWKDGAAQPTTDNLHADVCEIVVFDRALGSALFGLVLGALAQKWGA